MKRPRFYQKKLRKKGKFKRGFYIPINEDKYIQPSDKTMNQGPHPEYRSSWELAFYKYVDHQEDILFWSTEAQAIPYISPKDSQVHRYFPDVFIQKKNQNYIIEIKPKSQVLNPINQAKFAAAEEYCSRINAIFLVITEVELKAKGIICIEK